MIKVIILDADGVLINGERFSVRLAKEYGISLEQTASFFTGPFNECLIGNADLKEALVPYLEEWGWKTGVDAFLEYWFAAEHSIDEELVAYIQELRKQGIKCFVATNQEKHRAEYMLEKMGFADSFDKLYASAHLGHKKPSIVFYEKLLAELGDVQKGEVLFWDDAPENIEGAKEFGIHAELYTSFDDFKQKMNRYVKPDRTPLKDGRSASLEMCKGYLGKKVSLVIDQAYGTYYKNALYTENYGYIPDTLAPDGMELDAYFLGRKEALEKAEGTVIAIIHRLDDDDDKLIVVPDGVSMTDEEIDAAVNFREKFFKHEIVR